MAFSATVGEGFRGGPVRSIPIYLAYTCDLTGKFDRYVSSLQGRLLPDAFSIIQSSIILTSILA
jgi:hypothetical protein